MMDGTKQQKEIETIKERIVVLKLSDADCERLVKKAVRAGLTVGGLLESFIGDLVDGTYTNGSDERMYAEQWYERCGYGMHSEDTLLKYFLDWGRDVEEFLDVCEEMKHFNEHPEDYAGEIEDLLPGEGLGFIEDYHYFIDEFVEKHPETDLEKEIEDCRKWLKDYQKFLGE